MSEEVGKRYDAGKLRMDLMPPEWKIELARVNTAGSAKYGDHNWTKGMPWSKVVGPLERHLGKFQLGETHDKETGCHHLAMVAWNALALMTYDLHKLGTNDLLNLSSIYDVDKLSLVIHSAQQQLKPPTEYVPITKWVEPKGDKGPDPFAGYGIMAYPRKKDFDIPNKETD